MIIAQGANFGGWAIYAHEGKLKYIYNFLGLEMYEVETEETLPAGDHQVRLEFAYDGGGLGKGGTATLYLDGDKIGEGRVEHTHATIFAADCDGAGRQQVRRPDRPGSEDRGQPVQRHDQGRADRPRSSTTPTTYVSDAERWRVAMAIQ